MSTGAAWLKPTKIKLVFLVEWSLFIVIEMVRGKLKSGHSILVAGYPLIFFYLVACTLVALCQPVQQVAHNWKLPALAVGLTLLDQVLKMVVTAFIPNDASIPIVENWLHVAHARNYEGAWVVGAFDLPGTTVINFIQWGMAISILSLSMFCHRYYVTTHRQSLWADVAFLGILAACASWICDMVFRGYIVDFINLPGLVTADLKDIFVTIGVAAFFAESLDHHKFSWKWKGWQEESRDTFRLMSDIGRFSIQELRKTQQAAINRLKLYIGHERNSE